MKILMLNGSPHAKGNTAAALSEMEKIFTAEGFTVETVQVGHLPLRGCAACASCRKTGKCVFDDAVNEIAQKFETADGLVVASPVYYASANGTLVSCLDRLFYSTGFDKTMKVGASVAVARRGGTTATLDELNKYFLVAGMPVAAGNYWNMFHGVPAEGSEADGEGLQTLRVTARNMAFLIKSIALGKEAFGLPEKEAKIRTNFIR